MTLIRGSHGEPRSVTAPSVAEIDQPNHSFRYLTVDPAAPDAGALLPADDPGTVIQALKDLADQMYEESDTATEKSPIPPVYTYWGQFIDHDITAGTDRPSNAGFQGLSSDILNADFAPHALTDVEARIVNLRLPNLDLDSVYGGEEGPQTFGVREEGIYEADDLHLRLGENSTFGAAIPPAGLAGIEKRRDLPRRQPDEVEEQDRWGEARIGDGRNDENVIIAQFHVAFLHFHNRVVDFLDQNPAVAGDPLLAGHTKFGAARQIVRWTYQWLVVEDYLKTIAQEQVVNELRDAESHFFSDRAHSFMPLEFSVAGFRFGHTMVRAAYDYNLNFTMHSPRLGPAGLEELFHFTHGGRLGANPNANGVIETPNTQLVDVWIIDWERFADKNSPVDEQFARKIDTNLALPLKELRNVRPEILAINKNLARRNLLRGYLFNLPSGQHVAQWLGAAPLTDIVPTDKENVARILVESGLDQRTPLWYYLLREAELSENGDRLGETGSRLVAGSLISMLKADPDSYLNQGWDPSHATAMKLPGGQEIRQIMDFFRFAGVAPQVQVSVAAPTA